MSQSCTPLVSVITVNYHQAKLTCDLLDSIRIQNTYPNLEVIVVDNEADKDQTALFRGRLPEVKVLQSRENLGFAGGNNLGINFANGEYLFFVNNDTLWTVGLIEKLVERLQTEPLAGGVSPKIRYHHDPRRIQFAGFTPVHPLTGRNKTIGKNEIDKGQYDAARETPYLHGAAMMIRREIIDTVGKMPESYFLYYEELDWCAHMRRKGYQLWYEPQVHIFHRESASTGKVSALKVYYQTRNRLRFMQRNYSGGAFLVFLCYWWLAVAPFKFAKLLLTAQWDLLAAFMKGSFGQEWLDFPKQVLSQAA